MKKVYHIVSDASHAWLKVPMKELESLGIVEQISYCSYIRNGMAYLEEDVDMGVFMSAKEALGQVVKLKEFARGGQSRIRGYETFQHTAQAATPAAVSMMEERMVEQTNAMTGEKFMEPEGTPYYASPRSETYWSA